LSPRLFISDLKAGSAVSGQFFLRAVSKRRTKAGQPYLTLELSDKSGIIDARCWDAETEAARTLREGVFVQVEGSVENYRGRLQIRLAGISLVDAEEIDMQDYLPASYRDRDEMAGYLQYFLSEIYDPDLLQLLESFFGDAVFLERFCLAPGDLRTHHAYLGGLIEHTISVATLCQHVAVQHPRLDSDLLVTAALLHDIGKVDEFTFEGRIGYSREGKLLGHVLLGQRLIEEHIRGMPEFPKERELTLLHAVISHHGELEWGAPKRPQSAEALVLHHIDNLDARVKGFLEIVEGRGEATWPELQNYFRRPLDEPRAADRQ
jgi:3'-5' exoribonuclease